MGDSVDSIQPVTRDARFLPGARRAYFSTDLGTQAHRLIGSGLAPAVVRSTNDPVAVVQAARYWQIKYKNQCLCIFPNQRWTVEDLWDAADIFAEGRQFCEQMLTFIARDTLYAADRFAKDWAREHPDRLNFTGINIGNVYDLNDPLTALDQIFVFGEINSFPRAFLWHVAFILIASWNDSSLANNAALDSIQNQQLFVGPQQDVGEAQATTITVAKSDSKKAETLPDETGRTATATLTTSDHSRLQPPSQRATSYVPQQPGEFQSYTRYSGIEPHNTRAQVLKGSKGSRNLGSGLYNQPQGWIENESRTVSGPYPRRDPVGIPGIQSAQYIPVQMAGGPQIPAPIIPSSTMNPYLLGPPMMSHPGYPVQTVEPAEASRGHTGYQTGVARGMQMNPAYINDPQAPQPMLMGEMTNMHFPGHMGSQGIDPRAPIPRRSNHSGANQLYDPYNGNNRKFSAGQAYGDTGKKGGPYGFTAPQHRGRKISTSSGRSVHSSHNHMLPTGPRYNEISSRRRQSEDDPKITGDSISGCGHTWIGPNNTTVKELWVGDLPPDVSESEILQLFEQTIGITPIAISLRHNAGKGPFHAFATFASCADAKVALTINRSDPQLRNGEVRPTVSVPRRFYQKESPPTVYSDYSRTNQAASSHIRVATNLSHNEKSTSINTDNVMAKSRDVVFYSPQDARSGLPKKPFVQSNIASHAETAVSESENSKRQQKSPTKKDRNKNKRESPFKKEPSINEEPEVDEEPEINMISPVTTKDDKSCRQDDQSVENTQPTESQVVPSSNPGQEVCHTADEGRESIAQPSGQSSQLDSGQYQDNTSRSTPLPTDTDTRLGKKPTQIPHSDDTRKSTPRAGNESNDDASDTEGNENKSFDSATEVQSEAEQMEPKAEIRDQANTANHGTVAPTSQIVSENTLQDRPEFPVMAEEPEPDAAQEAYLEPEKPETVASNTENIPEASKTREISGQDKEITPDTAHTEATPAQKGANMSAPVEPTPTDTAKKAGAQQMHSLHPFATKNKAQAKKEKETKKKKQKKEDADRVAKAKANKIASLKKTKIATDPQRELETSMDSTSSPTAADVRFDLDAAGAKTEKHTPEEAKTTDVNTEDSQKKVNKADESVQHPKVEQASSTEPELQLDSKPLPSPQVLSSTSVSRKVISPNTQSHDEAGPSNKDSTTTPTTHILECETGSDKKPSTSLLAIPTSSAEKSEHDQSIASPRQSLSRYSSTSTLAGDDVHETTDARSAPEDNIGTSDPPQGTPTGETAAQSENASAETPKKKKRKNKKKNKKKTPASELSTDGQSAADERASKPVVPHSWDMHRYDPFTSQMTHIEAIRFAVKHDTSSYFAQTNARMETKRRVQEANEALFNSRQGEGEGEGEGEGKGEGEDEGEGKGESSNSG
ncbi:hypothetical protein J3E72DRAFT_372172 [Bipolaris maydis]|nr:hypothetical protein J3E72DRAFT_372172 [Bipolaris maydis]